MASLHNDRRTGNWILMFRIDGQQIRRSCKTKHAGRAKAIQSRVAEKLRLIELGDVSIPQGADPAVWLMSDGRKKSRPISTTSSRRNRLDVICNEYLKDQVDKAETTLYGERQHITHLKRVLRESTAIGSIGRPEMQRYVRSRRNQKFRNKLISGTTIRKELVTFQQIWRWAKRAGHVKTQCPIYDDDGRWWLPLPKSSERIKFQTWTQIERRVSRGGLDKDEIKKQWNSLFLDGSEVVELLQHVKENAVYDFIYPMYVFCAFTGARRSEILRSEIDDFDFEEGTVLIREKKRKRHVKQSTRHLPMHAELQRVMRQWFTKHPGGSFTITQPLVMPRREQRTEYLPLAPHEATHHYKRAIADSKWSVLHGFHVLRHSFGANLARTGKVQMNQIGEWMGHSTQDMMEHYQHLFPQDGANKIQMLNYG